MARKLVERYDILHGMGPAQRPSFTSYYAGKRVGRHCCSTPWSQRFRWPPLWISVQPNAATNANIGGIVAASLFGFVMLASRGLHCFEVRVGVCGGRWSGAGPWVVGWAVTESAQFCCPIGRR